MMGWDSINESLSPESKADAQKKADNEKQTQVDMAQAYHRLFSTKDGKRVLADLTQRMIYNNDTPIDSPNINYQAAYKNGEGGTIKFIIHQITRAEVI